MVDFFFQQPDFTINEDDLIEMCKIPSKVHMYRSNFVPIYEDIRADEFYQKKFNELTESQKERIHRKLRTEWPVWYAMKDHDRYLRHQSTLKRRLRRAYVYKRHDARYLKVCGLSFFFNLYFLI